MTSPLGVLYERLHAQDLSSDQVNGRSTSNVVCLLIFLVSFQPVKRTGIYGTELFTQEAIKKINAHDVSKPMFLYLAHQAVHSANKNDPLQAPEDLIQVTKDTVW